MHPAALRGRLALLASLVLPALLAGCGSGASDEGTATTFGPVRWMASGSGQRDAAEPAARTVRRPRVTDDRWVAQGATRREVAPPPYDPQGAPVLQLTGPDDLVVTVPGPIPAEATLLEVVLVTRHRTTITPSLARARGDRDPALESLQRTLKNGSLAPERLSFRRLPEADNPRPFDELRLRIEGGGGRVFLHEVAWTEGRLDEGLPSAADGGELTFLGQDGRHGVAVTQDRPLRTSVAQAEGTQLVLQGGLPRDLQRPNMNARLELVARGRGGSELRRVLGLRAGQWRTLAVDLTPLGSGAANVSLELAAEGPALGLVGDAHLVPAQPPAEPPPLVLLVSSDTHRADHLGQAGGPPGVSTPNLDALATRGVRLADAWSSANVTLPSHAALLTGLHPRDSGVRNNGTTVGRSAATLAERFREAGWGTLGVVSSRHLSDVISGFGQGFDRYHQTARTMETADRSVARLQAWIEADRGRPLFAFLHLFDAHAPYSPPEAYAQAQGAAELGRHEAQRALYRGEVAFLDAQLGRLLDLPRVRSGIVAVTSDHGESLGAHGILFDHAELYPDTLHVPLLLAWPGAPAGRVVPGAARQLDLGRTLLDLAGLVRADFPGENLLALVEGQGDPARATYALCSGATSASVRQGGWMLTLHLVRHASPAAGPAQVFERHQVELYHLDEDPGALQELSQARPERARELRTLLVEWLRAAELAGVAEVAELDSASLAALQQLGYGGGDLGGTEAAAELFPADCPCPRCESFH